MTWLGRMPLDRALDDAIEHPHWSRCYRDGWRCPSEVYQALEIEVPPHPTWESATGALAHALLKVREQLGARR